MCWIFDVVLSPTMNLANMNVTIHIITCNDRLRLYLYCYGASILIFMRLLFVAMCQNIIANMEMYCVADFRMHTNEYMDISNRMQTKSSRGTDYVSGAILFAHTNSAQMDWYYSIYAHRVHK